MIADRSNGVVVGGIFSHPLDDLVAQSRSNNLHMYKNSKNFDPKYFSMIPTFSEKTTQKNLDLKFKVQGVLRQEII